ncbi:hypothetical protein JOD17_000630 [Geomicrobium sediminis]|uniref:Holin-like toxin n=1 Tax=Geomicrobium sediminis TaxID=1347788 RepID=A0ABS2P7Z8_9BACL|nr:hypothetical protein [Geomicrobium sediminis]
MDGLAITIMQVFTILLAVGTIGGSLFVGKVWRNDTKKN